MTQKQDASLKETNLKDEIEKVKQSLQDLKVKPDYKE